MMTLKLLSIGDRGNASQERIHIKASAAANLLYFAVFSSSVVGDKVLRSPRHTFWFYDHSVQANDDIIIYTRAGTDNVLPRPEGGFNHFFFWGLPNAEFPSPDHTAVLLELKEWFTLPIA